MNRERKATVLSTGKEVTVYKHKERGTWIEFPNCETEYKNNELTFKQ